MSFMASIKPAAETVRRVSVMQGQARVTSDARVELTTVLGSCIATCLFDPVNGVGGMNHFLLAEPARQNGDRVDENYGVYLMEVLINEMLAWGASKVNLRAHIYGGANLHAGMTRIGSANSMFARDFLERERIPLVRSEIGGTSARRVDFQASLGRARSRTVASAMAPNLKLTTRPARAGGDVELF